MVATLIPNSLDQDRNLWAYCSLDSLVTKSAEKPVYEDAKELGVVGYYHNTCLPLAREVLRMQNRGLPFDFAVNKGLDAELEKELQRIERKVKRLMGSEFNPRSTQQVGEFLTGPKDKGCLGIPVHRRTETGLVKVDEETLQWYQTKTDHPLIPLVLELREIGDFHEEYVVSVARRVSADGRLRCRLLIHVVPTTRLAAREPNLQNQPKRCNPEWGRRIRDQYSALPLKPIKSRAVRVDPLGDPGPLLQIHDSFLWTVWTGTKWEMWEQDLQGAEKRISYYESGDDLGISRLLEYDKLIKAGKHEEAKRWDVHRCNAMDAFPSLKFEDITDRIRNFMKNWSYGTAYGGRGETMNVPPDLLVILQQLTGMKGRDAIKKAEENYWKRHKKENDWRDSIKDKIVKERTLTYSDGTRRSFFGHLKDDIKSGLNDPCQRGVARIMNSALLEMKNETWQCKSLPALRERMDGYVVKERQWASGITAAVPTEWKQGPSWGQLKE